MSKIIWNTKSIIFLVILIYLSLAIFNINYPGLHSDEAHSGVVSKSIFKDAPDAYGAGIPFVNYHILLFRKIFPIMMGDYVGATVPYLIYPFIRIFGSNAISLRLSSIFIFVIFLLFVYKLCRIWFGERVGLLAILLTATNLIFVQYSRVGLYRIEIFVMFFFWTGLFFLIKYSQAKKIIFLFLSFFFFGLGLSTKITFLYYIVASVIAYSLLGKRLNLVNYLTLKKSIIILLSFCFGAFFIIIYNIKEPWKTVKLLSAVLIAPTATRTHVAGPDAANNLAYLNNLYIRMTHLLTILRGDVSSRFDWGVTKTCFIESISPIVMGWTIVSFLLILFLALFLPNLPKIIKYRILFLYIIYLIVFFLTPFTLSGFNQGHLLVLLPFPQVVMALFLDYMWQWTRHKKMVLITTYSIFLIPVLLFNIWMNIYFNIEMKKTGGYNRWSTALIKLADYLQKNKISSPVMFNYGLHANLMFLTDNRVTPIIYSKFYPDPIVSAYSQLFLRNKQIFYLTIVSDINKEENLSHVNLFMRFAKNFRKKIELEKIFFNRVGDPVYWLYKIY